MAQAMLYGTGGGSSQPKIATGTFTSDNYELSVTGLPFKPVGFMMSSEENAYSDSDPRYIMTVWSFDKTDTYPHCRYVYKPSSTGDMSRTRYRHSSDCGDITWGSNSILIEYTDDVYEYIDGVWHYVVWGE